MDLNVALSENFSEMKHHSFINFITSEEKYRLWLIDLLREEYVIVITARDIKWKEQTFPSPPFLFQVLFDPRFRCR